MSHPLIPAIHALAAEIAPSLGLEVAFVAVHTHKNPAVVRVDIRNLQEDTGLTDCERMSLALEEQLDQSDLIPFPYVLEVSSPGIAPHLTTDREFLAFRGFTIAISAHTPYLGKEAWTGKLVTRNEEHITLSQRGKLVQIPRSIVAKVELA